MVYIHVFYGTNLKTLDSDLKLVELGNFDGWADVFCCFLGRHTSQSIQGVFLIWWPNGINYFEIFARE